jgi:ketosteroid isomerase-like protein
MAFVSAATRCPGSETSGKDVELDFRLTIGLRKSDGQWVIVHEHHSVPAE